MSDIWNRMERVLSVHAPPVLKSLRPPATAAQIADAEALLELRFPDEVRAAYLRHDGQVAGADWTYLPGAGTANDAISIFHYGFDWCNLEQLKTIWSRFFNGRWQSRENNPGEFPAYDPYWDGLAVKPLLWNRKWIPIGISTGMCIGYVDTDPAPAGVMGQMLIDLGTGADDGEAVAPSLNSYLTALLDALEIGEILYDTGYGFIGGTKRCRIRTLLPNVTVWDNMPVHPSSKSPNLGSSL
jgi:cell wall assembly regulator SMI1